MWTYLPYLHIFRQNYRNALPTIMGFLKASLLTKEVISQQRKCGNETMLMELPYCHHPKAPSLIEWWNSLLKLSYGVSWVVTSCGFEGISSRLW